MQQTDNGESSASWSEDCTVLAHNSKSEVQYGFDVYYKSYRLITHIEDMVFSFHEYMH